jgi:hypothetical protein
VNSVIYRGEVMHTRLEPVRHVFRYPVYFYGFDLSGRLDLKGLQRLLDSIPFDDSSIPAEIIVHPGFHTDEVSWGYDWEGELNLSLFRKLVSVDEAKKILARNFTPSSIISNPPLSCWRVAYWESCLWFCSAG